MSIYQLNMYGMDKVQTAIKRLQTFEPPDGYYLAFSGGKDSVVIKTLADMAGVRYDAHYNVTGIDPPELAYFIRQHHPNVVWEYPRDKDGEVITMWRLIRKKKMPPTRIVRYCCEALKEGGGEGRFVITGVRWAESVRRSNSRAGLEVNFTKKGNGMRTDPDNPDNAKLVRFCPTRGKHILNPIIDWDDSEIWEFIHDYGVPYCELYDCGHKRLGCIGCPVSGKQRDELNKYPKIKKLYLRAFEKMLVARQDAGLGCDWQTGEDVMNWWTGRERGR